jgi:hypothetical protein
MQSETLKCHRKPRRLGDLSRFASAAQKVVEQSANKKLI